MRNLPQSFAESIDAEVTTLATALKVTRADGEVLALTDHNEPIRFGGTTYVPNLTPATIGAEAGRGDTADFDIQIRNFEHDVAAGRYDRAEIEVYAVDWRSRESVLMNKGTLGEQDRNETGLTLQFESLIESLDRRQGRNYSSVCDAQFGDKRCGIANFATRWQMPATIGVSPPQEDAFIRITPEGNGMLTPEQLAQPAHFRCRVRFPDADLSIYRANGTLFEYTDSGGNTENSLWVGWNGRFGLRVLVRNDRQDLIGRGVGNDIPPSRLAPYRDGELHEVEWQVDLGDDTRPARIRIWIDGTLLLNETDTRTGGSWGNGSYGYLRAFPESRRLFHQPGTPWVAPEGASDLEIHIGYNGNSLIGTSEIEPTLTPSPTSKLFSISWDEDDPYYDALAMEHNLTPAELTATKAYHEAFLSETGRFAHGFIEITSGANAGLRRWIIGHTNRLLQLWRPFPFALEHGATAVVTSGCRRDFATCTAYENTVNFRGFPYIPGNEVLGREATNPCEEPTNMGTASSYNQPSTMPSDGPGYGPGSHSGLPEPDLREGHDRTFVHGREPPETTEDLIRGLSPPGSPNRDSPFRDGGGDPDPDPGGYIGFDDPDDPGGFDDSPDGGGGGGGDK